jgi:DNA-binding protein Fis
VIAGKCRDFIYSDDDSSSVSTHGTGANIDQFELKNKIEGTENKYLSFPDGVDANDQWRMSLGTCERLILCLVRLSVACDLCVY